MAAPMTSARSQAAMAISQRTQRTMRDRARVVIAAGLGEVAAAGDAEARGERLQQDRHQVGDHDDAEERVAEAGAAGEVGGPVAGVHVADGDEVAGAGEGEELAPEAGVVGDGDGAVDFGQAARAGRQAPRRGRASTGLSVAIVSKFDDSKSVPIIAARQAFG